MKFTIENGIVDARIVEGNLRLADRLLAVPDPAKRRDAARVLNLTDGLVHFVDRTTGEMPAGLIPRLKRRLEKRGHTVEVVGDDQSGHRVDPVPVDFLIGADLRPYQHEAVNTAIQEMRGVIWAATNAGKSYILAALAGGLFNQKGYKSLVIVPNGHLLHQTSEDIRKLLGPTVKVEAAGDGLRPSDPDVLVGTFQTLATALSSTARSYAVIRHFVSACRGVFVDEAHRANSASITSVLRAATSAVYRIGMSGSVDKRDHTVSSKDDDANKHHRVMLERYLGPVIYRVTNEQLIELGVSAKPTIYAIRARSAFGPTVETPIPKRNENVYSLVFDRAIVANRRFHRSIVRLAATLLEQGKPPFVFSHSIPHLKALSEVATAMEVKHRVVYGEDPVSRRQRIVKRYAENMDFVVFASTVFDEGISLPAIRSIVFAGARKSVREVLQRTGRGLRKKDDDNTVVIIDALMPHQTMLHRHALARMATFEAEGFQINYIDNFDEIERIAF